MVEPQRQGPFRLGMDATLASRCDVPRGHDVRSEAFKEIYPFSGS
jgi:hypothetical protein